MEQSKRALTAEELLQLLNSTDYNAILKTEATDSAEVLSEADLNKLLDRDNLINAKTSDFNVKDVDQTADTARKGKVFTLVSEDTVAEI